MSTEPTSALTLLDGANTKRTNILDQVRTAGAALARGQTPTSSAGASAQQGATEARDPATPTSDDPQRAFILGVVQPGLAGLMDGSISSLAPLFAAAFATRNSWTAFLVGLATAIGAGVSMAFSEGLSDDGKVSGRGSSWVRGPVCGVMTFLGAAGHTLPFLLPVFVTAVLLAGGVVLVELLLIAWIRKRYMDTPLLAAIFQVVVGGVIVFLAGILIGSA
jgi:erythrin-vacuolar iron transport family protein